MSAPWSSGVNQFPSNFWGSDVFTSIWDFRLPLSTTAGSKVNMGKIQKNIVEDTKKVAFHVKSDSTVI